MFQPKRKKIGNKPIGEGEFGG